MTEVCYNEAGTGRTHRMVVDLAQPAVAEALQPMHWLPLAPRRYVDAPVTGSDGQAYMALPFEHSIDRQVRCLLSSKPADGSFRVTHAHIVTAIERLQAYADRLPSEG